MTMWRPNEPVEEGVSDLPGGDLQSKRRRSHRRAWRDGLADQPVVTTLEDARSYRAFERALIGSVDPRSVLELALAHRLASLLWRLRRASAIETVLFEIQGELQSERQQVRTRGPGNRRRSKLTFKPTATRSPLVRAGETIRRPATKNGCRRPRARHVHHARNPAPSPNVSCASPMLTRPCLTALAATKRDCGAKPRKQSGPLML